MQGPAKNDSFSAVKFHLKADKPVGTTSPESEKRKGKGMWRQQQRDTNISEEGRTKAQMRDSLVLGGKSLVRLRWR